MVQGLARNKLVMINFDRSCTYLLATMQKHTNGNLGAAGKENLCINTNHVANRIHT